jgi:hypothetical protein
MAFIGCRSPHHIIVDETGQQGSKIEIFIWNQGTTEPTSPSYTLSKAIAASNNTATTYNVSPYITEFLTFNEFNQLNYGISSMPIKLYANVKIKRYKYASSTYTLLDTTTYLSTYGFGYYSEQYNNNGTSTYLLNDGTYYYYYNDNTTLGYNGNMYLYMTSGQKVKYTDLENNANTFTYTASTTGFKEIATVHEDCWAVGNKLEVLTSSNTVLKTWYFKVQTECLYAPVLVDFINRFGVWQRVAMFKKSVKSLNVNSETFNKMPSSYNYLTTEPQRKMFNVSGTEKIKVNSGFVDESFNANVLKQLMLSETILVNNAPAILSSKGVDYQTNINNGLKNYSLEFEFAYNEVRDVI